MRSNYLLLNMSTKSNKPHVRKTFPVKNIGLDNIIKSTNNIKKSFSTSNNINNENDMINDINYRYIDSGDGYRLEKFGSYYVIRSCVSATWRKNWNIPEWNNESALKYTGVSGFAGTWANTENIDNKMTGANWTAKFDDNMVFNLRPSEQGQVGVFPEQQENWKWITKMCTEFVTTHSKISGKSEIIDFKIIGSFPTPSINDSSSASSKVESSSSGSTDTSLNLTGTATTTTTNDSDTSEKLIPRVMRVLNGFAYTGGSSLAALRTPSVEVVHFDAAKAAVQVACKNAYTSELIHRPCRYLVDDCFRFIEREIRRKSKYHGLILDPPAFGRASKMTPKSWEISRDLPVLVKSIPKLLTSDAKFILLSCHDQSFTPESLQELLRPYVPSNGIFETGEMTLKSCYTSGPLKGNNLPLGIYCRWHRK